MGSLISTARQIYNVTHPPTVPKHQNALKFGILGAANIAPMAFIQPARSHPDVIVYAIAARDKGRAEAYAKKHGITKVYGGPNGYQELLDDPEIDAIYNPLPNGLHFEWTMKALTAGKHVLLEKPSSNTAEDTRVMFEFAEKKGLVLLEAFHYRFHPAIQRVKAILDSGELGVILSIDSELEMPSGFIKDDDIRFKYDLGGGAMMDMGCYPLSNIRYLASTEPTAVINASAKTFGSPNVDLSTIASLALPNNATASLSCNMRRAWKYGGLLPGFPESGVRVHCEMGSVELDQFIMPPLTHSIIVKDAGGGGRIEEAYTFDDKGEKWWSTYRYQLEAFVDKLRGRTPQTWVTKEDSIANMKWIEEVYVKTGLGTRPKSTYVLAQDGACQ